MGNNYAVYSVRKLSPLHLEASIILGNVQRNMYNHKVASELAKDLSLSYRSLTLSVHAWGYCNCFVFLCVHLCVFTLKELALIVHMLSMVDITYCLFTVWLFKKSEDVASLAHLKVPHNLCKLHIHQQLYTGKADNSIVATAIMNDE